jgi:hypothetical protein
MVFIENNTREAKRQSGVAVPDEACIASARSAYIVAEK